jgi:uncharacterized protein (TIGR03032 family)
VASQWLGASDVDPAALAGRASGPWWDLLDELRITLLVSREYEHLLLAMRAERGVPEVSFFPLPHPSGIAVDRERGRVHVASTRNPNQVYTFAPVTGARRRDGVDDGPAHRRPLVPIASTFVAGCLYLHDLAMIGSKLHGTATGENAVVRFEPAGDVRRTWWPRSIERNGRPVFERNHIQLNAIAAGPSLAQSHFVASSADMARRRPGHRNYPVDGRGVVLSGRTREPVAFGLTRPHSLRRGEGRLWVANSGYGELAVITGDTFEPVARLPGWTRGLAVHNGIAFVGTSRVIPRFRAYAPGVRIDDSVCGIHAVDLKSGAIRAAYTWPAGNQIFAVEPVPSGLTGGFALLRRRSRRQERDLFFAFETRR